MSARRFRTLPPRPTRSQLALVDLLAAHGPMTAAELAAHPSLPRCYGPSGCGMAGPLTWLRDRHGLVVDDGGSPRRWRVEAVA